MAAPAVAGVVDRIRAAAAACTPGTAHWLDTEGRIPEPAADSHPGYSRRDRPAAAVARIRAGHTLAAPDTAADSPVPAPADTGPVRNHRRDGRRLLAVPRSSIPLASNVAAVGWRSRWSACLGRLLPPRRRLLRLPLRRWLGSFGWTWLHTGCVLLELPCDGPKRGESYSLLNALTCGVLRFGRVRPAKYKRDALRGPVRDYNLCHGGERPGIPTHCPLARYGTPSPGGNPGSPRKRTPVGTIAQNCSAALNHRFLG